MLWQRNSFRTHTQKPFRFFTPRTSHPPMHPRTYTIVRLHTQMDARAEITARAPIIMTPRIPCNCLHMPYIMHPGSSVLVMIRPCAHRLTKARDAVSHFSATASLERRPAHAESHDCDGPPNYDAAHGQQTHNACAPLVMDSHAMAWGQQLRSGRGKASTHRQRKRRAIPHCRERALALRHWLLWTEMQLE